MPRTRRCSGAALFFCAAIAGGQTQAAAPETPPPPSPSDAPATPAPPVRPPEGSIIINLPSADTNPTGSLQFNISHRFKGAVDSDTHTFFSFFTGSQVNLGLSYVPLKGLEAGMLRAEEREDYEFFAKWSFLSSTSSPFHAAARVGVDWRTGRIGSDDPSDDRDNRSSVFVQGILAWTIASRVRITAVPTYATKALTPDPALFGGVLYPKDVFNVPVAVSAAITRSINVQAEVIPRRDGAPAVGWIAAIEKTVLRHRFSFTVGNLSTTTVDQYLLPNFVATASPRRAYFGFNIIRTWKLN